MSIVAYTNETYFVMQIEPIYTVSFIAINIYITYLFRKRFNPNSGCMAFGYFGAVIFCINLFCIFSWLFFTSSVEEVFTSFTSGDDYTAKVVSYTTEQHYDSDDGTYTDMHTPTVRFVTKEGIEVEKELDFSTSGLEVGDTYEVNYNKENDSVITKGFTMYIKLAGSFIFCFILTFLFVGQIQYIRNKSMDKFYHILQVVGFYFFIPFLMIGFDALLIYALFNGNEIPLAITLVLLFFILVLTLGIYGYIKSMYRKGLPKMRRTGPGRWSGGWED